MAYTAPETASRYSAPQGRHEPSFVGLCKELWIDSKLSSVHRFKVIKSDISFHKQFEFFITIKCLVQN